MISGQWLEWAIVMILPAAFVAWVTWRISLYTKRHPGVAELALRARKPIRLAGKIYRSLGLGVALLLVVWIFFAWITHVVETGDWTPLLPKTSPWQRLMVGRRLRPWNIYALGALYLALSALVLDLLLSQVRIIRNSLQRVAGDLGLSFVEDASQYATDWLRKRSAFSILTAVANQTTKDEAEDDWILLANPCWAVHPKRDPRRLLVTSYGPGSKSYIGVSGNEHRAEQRK